MTYRDLLEAAEQESICALETYDWLRVLGNGAFGQVGAAIANWPHCHIAVSTAPRARRRRVGMQCHCICDLSSAISPFAVATAFTICMCHLPLPLPYVDRARSATARSIAIALTARARRRRGLEAHAVRERETKDEHAVREIYIYRPGLLSLDARVTVTSISPRWCHHDVAVWSPLCRSSSCRSTDRTTRAR